MRLESDRIIHKIKSEMRACCKAVDNLHLSGYNETFTCVGNLLRCARNNHYYHVLDFDVHEMRSINDDAGLLRNVFIVAVSHRTERIKGLYLRNMKCDSLTY
jgi:hypothetical protein